MRRSFAVVAFALYGVLFAVELLRAQSPVVDISGTWVTGLDDKTSYTFRVDSADRDRGVIVRVDEPNGFSVRQEWSGRYRVYNSRQIVIVTANPYDKDQPLNGSSIQLWEFDGAQGVLRHVGDDVVPLFATLRRARNPPVVPPPPVQPRTPSGPTAIRQAPAAPASSALVGRWESVGYGLKLNPDGTFVEYYFGSSFNPLPERTGIYTVRGNKVDFLYSAGLPPGRLPRDCSWTVRGDTLNFCNGDMRRRTDY